MAEAEHHDSNTCIACKLDIPQGASVCTHCNSFQAQWKNTVQYLSRLFGVITIALGASTYIVSSLPEIRKIVFWSDSVKVLSFSSNQGVSLANTGDGDIFVTHIYLKGSTNESYFTTVQPINRVIPVGGVISQEFDHPDLPGKYHVVHGVSDSEWKMMLEDSSFIKILISPNDMNFLQFKDALPELRTFDAEATIHYYSIDKDRKHTQEIPMTGILYAPE
jgi:hypothetical protein